MLLRATETSFRTLDGLHVAGTVVEPEDRPVGAVVFVHSGGGCPSLAAIASCNSRTSGRLRQGVYHVCSERFDEVGVCSKAGGPLILVRGQVGSPAAQRSLGHARRPVSIARRRVCGGWPRGIGRRHVAASCLLLLCLPCDVYFVG